MTWNLKAAADHYRRQGAPGDQNALRLFLSELQAEHGGAIPRQLLAEAAENLGVKESFLLAIVRRIPSLHLADHHVLEICAGPNCSPRADLSRMVPKSVEVRFVPCMRQCGKGPNIRFDGKLYSNADGTLLAGLMDGIDN